jgi:pimeloyl-ACP methyl ester carboxylesterase
MRRMFAANAPWDLRGEVATVGRRIPTLVLLPPDSFYVPDPDAAALREALRPGAVVTVPGTGHSIHRDDMDAFLAAIDALGATGG